MVLLWGKEARAQISVPCPKSQAKRIAKDLNLDSLLPNQCWSPHPQHLSTLPWWPHSPATALCQLTAQEFPSPLGSHHHLLIPREPHLSHFSPSVWASGEESHNSLDKLAHVLLRPGGRHYKAGTRNHRKNKYFIWGWRSSF